MAECSNTKLIELLKRVEIKDASNPYLQQMYERHGEKTVEGLVLDLRKDASNTFGWIFTGPIDYDECIRRVAIKVGIDENDLKGDEKQNELLVLIACLKKYFDGLDPAERETKKQEIFNEIGEEHEDFFNAFFLGSFTAILAVMQVVGPAIIRQMVFECIAIFAAGQIALNATRMLTLAVPFLNVIMAGWLAWDVAGPAYRKIIPSILAIAALRLGDSA
jgi:hypothetical protein